MIEEWKMVVGYEELYEVSSYGNVKSLERKGVRQDRILKQETVRGNYLAVHLSENNVKTHKYIHHLVLEAFVGPCLFNMVAYHKDSNRTNNNLTNLKWDTLKENTAEAIRINTHHFFRDKLGRFTNAA